ncbi:MAG TPA: nucleotidyltransferase family protein [Candidatus Acidoferrum sp.]|nr:nucleotidyltransferase family protein [Candidatus Acidoferrum sp.]
MLPVAILAGGLATRLGPVSEKVPKSLLEVNGEPFIFHQLRLLKAHGVQRVVLCVGYLGEMIREVVREGQDFGMEVDYSFDGTALLGTAGAVKNALPKLGNSFLVLYGDSYLVCDYTAVAREFLRANKLALMTVFKNEGQWDTSNVEYQADRILAYSKKNRTPRMHYIDYGLGAFSAQAFAGVPTAQASDLAELYARILEEGQLGGMEIQQRFYEIGSPAGLEETAHFLASQQAAQGVVRK